MPVSKTIKLEKDPNQIKITEPAVPEAPEVFTGKVQNVLGSKTTPTAEDEQVLGKIISDHFNINAVAELDGNRLNKTFGLIGGEQHLPRFPGDTAIEHFTEGEDIYPNLSGITPGRGAWGYFAPSKATLTPDLVQKERYYIAAQTFLSPGWGVRTKELYNWFQFRKIIIVNTKTGQSCVAVIGDAGPAQWTGKSFGGSPEVMIRVGYSTGSRKGPVLIYFVNDPENKIPLGPIN
jgi:hypothetical protein